MLHQLKKQKQSIYEHIRKLKKHNCAQKVALVQKGRESINKIWDPNRNNSTS